MASSGLSWLLPQCLWSEQKWFDKPPAAWSAKDIETIMDHSPWVHEVQLEADRTAAGLPKGSKQGGTLATDFKLLVRWESALPVRLARDRSARPEKSAPEYTLSFNRLPLAFTAALSGRDPFGREDDPEQTKADVASAMVRSTSLLRSDKPPVPAAHAEWVNGDFTSRILVSFSEGAQPLQLEDREVTVSTRIGTLIVRARFVLGEMLYRGQLAI